MKCIALFNFSDHDTTGALRRYINLYNYISKIEDNYCLLLNQKLYLNVKKHNILKTDKNVFVIDILRSGNKDKEQNNIANKSQLISEIKKNSHNKFKKYIGKRLSFLRNFKRWILFIPKYYKFVKENNIELVYGVYLGAIWTWPINKLLKIKLIYSVNNFIFSYTLNDYWSFFQSDYWVLKYCDKIDFLSTDMIPVLENNFFSRGSKYYAVSPCSFVDYTEFYPENPKVNNALFICRIEQHKNPLLLLNSIIVFNRKYKINEEIKFYLMGEGRLSDQVREFIKVNNLFNVEYLGSVINIAPWLRKSKIFFSIQEQTNYPSQSLLEAMACENAIIASDVGETRLLITENEGILVNLNAEKIAGAIYKLFSTPGLVTKLGKNARHKALNEHTIERYAEYIFSLTN